MLHAEKFPGAAPTREHLVGHQEHLSVVAEFAELREKIVGWHHGAAPALDRLEDEACDRTDCGLVEVLPVEFDVFVRVDRAIGLRPHWAIGVRARHHVRTRRARRAVDLRADVPEGYGAVGLAVKIVEAADRLVFSRGCAQHANTGFDRRRARIIELKAVEIAWEDRREFLHQLGFNRRGEVVRVHQLRRSLRDALTDLRVTVTERGHVNARGEIDVVVAIDVAQDAAVAGLERNGEEFHLAAQALEKLRAATVVVLRLRSWRRDGQVRHAREIDAAPFEGGKCFEGGGTHGERVLGATAMTSGPSLPKRFRTSAGALRSVMKISTSASDPQRARAVVPILVWSASTQLRLAT